MMVEAAEEVEEEAEVLMKVLEELNWIELLLNLILETRLC